MAQSTYQQINTEPGQTTLIIQPSSWMLVSVSCATVGPALVGSSPDLRPGTGQGVEVSTVPRYLFLEPGDTLYLYSASTDRVDIAMHPLSWVGILLQRLLQPGAVVAGAGVEVPYPKMPPFPTHPLTPIKKVR